EVILVTWREGTRAIANPDFTVILNEVKDLIPLQYEILRFAQNDIFRETGFAMASRLTDTCQAAAKICPIFSATAKGACLNDQKNRRLCGFHEYHALRRLRYALRSHPPFRRPGWRRSDAPQRLRGHRRRAGHLRSQL